ncbi:hypothetical protein GCM10010912_41630 [Paenibacillus albidus]|uniref:Uncharacterized protein n=1 Tax=Paenibacillus albidus TaxID=2041023 RepID=A0A917CM09_9BACL|nr:YhcN/YlaJ family sporulation lipoprotein [Paenibacillus albidus]GGF92337.1 hypothetical protein GCM10010912_41630 [Paenibacillus albidus]
MYILPQNGFKRGSNIHNDVFCWNDAFPAADGTRNGNSDGLKTAEDRVEVADRAAENIKKLKGVRQANVLVTRRNAYIAAALDDDQKKLTRDIGDQIAKQVQVRAADSNIQNVYVSTNPQFVDRINGYCAGLVRNIARTSEIVTGQKPLSSFALWTFFRIPTAAFHCLH